MTSGEALSVRDVVKSYGTKRAVDGVTLQVARGEVFGLLGPNGAGKTSLIRMVMDIMRPDAGGIRVLGESMSPALKHRIGYLPEERGLYQRQRVHEVLRFLGQIKGLDRSLAGLRADKYLDRVGLLEVRRKRLRELSKGMQQKVQLAAVLQHEPELLMLDEPFSGLDPVNRNVVIEILLEAASRGATVVLSTHLMQQVESLCRRVFLISRGKGALEGEVRSIKERYADHSILIEVEGTIPPHPAVLRSETREGRSRLWLREEALPEQILADLIRSGARVRHFERVLPSLDEIYVKVVA